MSKKEIPLRFAVIGARRGRTFIRSARSLEGRGVELVAICDTRQEMLDEWCDTPGVKLIREYEQVLNDPSIDAVCIATPVPLHARQAIGALEAGKHVLCEVTAAYTLEEGRELIAATERSGCTYMMAENYCFMEPVLQVQQMVEAGLFGELVYASGSYLHDCRPLFFYDDGELTWRGKLRHEQRGNLYPTHSLGPVARWLGINRHDRLVSTATWESRAAAPMHYAQRNVPGGAAYGEDCFWQAGDTVSTQISTEKGALIDLRIDWASARPHHMTRYELQGTRGAFTWPEGLPGQEPLVWIEGRSPADEKGVAKEWELLSNYREEFQHPLWKAHGEQAGATGHGGSDFFILREFLAAIEERRRPLIDVYDAVTWSSITPLSQQSLANGNRPVPVPDFKAFRS